jgi:hypothetical protein
MSGNTVSASQQTFDDIATIQTTIDGIEVEIEGLIAKGQALAYESGWTGPDADRWRADWEGETSPKLRTTLETLRSINTAARDSASNIMRAGGNMDFG